MEEWEHSLRRNSIVNLRAVHVSHNIVVEPWAGAFSRMTTLTSWDARPGTLKETSSDTLYSVRVEEVDEGKTVTGTVLEVHRHENKVELTAESKRWISEDVEVTC